MERKTIVLKGNKTYQLVPLQKAQICMATSTDGASSRSLSKKRDRNERFTHKRKSNPTEPLRAKDRLFLPDYHDYTDKCFHDDEGSDSGSESYTPRKRAKLGHLTADEKLLRRKLKNREAAQTARDRRRDYMDTLEERMHMLEKENLKLKLNSRNVESELQLIERENSLLRQQMDDILSRTSVKTSNVDITGIEAIVAKPESKQESAVLPESSQQQGPLIQAFVTMLTFLLMSAMLPSASDSSTPLLAAVLETTKKNQRKTSRPSKVMKLPNCTNNHSHKHNLDPP
jgi:hypothetical protein